MTNSIVIKIRTIISNYLKAIGYFLVFISKRIEYYKSDNRKSDTKEIFEKESLESSLEKYLLKYVNLDSPGFAVLVDGEWGAGKTYQVRSFMRELKLIEPKSLEEASSSGFEYIYVSLFGLTSTSEIYQEIAQSMIPIPKFIENLPKFLKVSSGFLPQILEIFIKYYISNKILIFDDLERSKMPIEKYLGVFSYCLNKGCKLILISSVSKLKNNENFPETLFEEIREKIVGQQIKIIPNLENAFEKFCQKLSPSIDKCKAFRFQDKILGIFKTSKCNSLRILEHVVRDVNNLLNSIDDKYLLDINAITMILNQFCAFDIEIRRGKLTLDDINNGMVYLWERVSNSNNYKFNENLDRFFNMYPSDSIFLNLLNFEVYNEIFKYGVFDQEKINKSLNQTIFSNSTYGLDTWEVLSRFSFFDVYDLNNTLSKFETQFKDREFVTSMTILKVFMVYFMMSDRNIIDYNFDEIYGQCQKYVYDFYANSEICIEDLVPFDNIDEKIEYEFFTDNFVELNSKTNKLKDLIICCRKKEFYNKSNLINDYILGLVSTNSLEFYEKFSETGKFFEIPILNITDPKKFVNYWLKGKTNQWIWVKNTIDSRIKKHKSNELFNEELNWVKFVGIELDSRIKESKGFLSAQINLIKPSVDS